MKKRYILLICLILCLICSAQTVIAGEIDTNDTKQDSIQTTDIDQVSNDNHVLSSIQDNDILNTTEDSFTQLNNLLSDTTKTTFDLSNNYIYTSSDGDALKNGITISRSITINGNGKIIDGNHQARIFNILAGCSVTLNGITFINGYASNGGAIYSDGILNMNHCKFINNTATNDGGAVYFEATPSSLTYLEFTSNHADYDGGAMFYHEKITGTHDEGLKHSTFTNNTAGNQGGALCLDGHDGKIINCTFTGNNATSDGGAIMFDGANWGVYDSTFTNNTAINRRGGAIYLEDGINTDIERCTFKYNFAGRNGGAIDWYDGAHDGQLINSTFEYNTAKGNGGAVYWRGHDGEITGCNFTHNRALGLTQGVYGNIGDGGAIIWSGSNGTVTNCRFIDNEAKRNSSSSSSGRGGAVFIQENGNINNENTTFIDCYFRNNTAGTNGGAIDWHQGASNGTIIHCEFINNTANRSAGAVFWFGIKGTIKDSNFTGNDAYGLVEAIDSYGDLTYGGYGGAIMWTGSVGYVTNCTFKYNEAHFNDATTTGGRGGAVYLQGSTQGNCTDTVFDKCIFIGNIAGTNGGAIDWHNDAHDGLVNNSLFEDNRAHANGGAIYWRGHHGDIYNSNFTNNKALGERSGTYGNIGDGGAIIWAGINGTVYNCRFEDNEAIKNPGNNASGRGGAVYVRNCTHGNENTTFEKCYFRNNTAGLNGGAVDWHEGAHDGVIISCNFINNTAKGNAGAVFWNGHGGNISHSNFTYNIAEGKVMDVMNNTGCGGAILWAGAEGDVYNCTFKYNEAHHDEITHFGGRGGAAYLQNNVNEDCSNTTFERCTFISNIAETNGGAIDWHEGAHDGKIINSTFKNNIAHSNAGAVYWRGHNGEIIDSNFTNNTAKGLHTGTYNNVGDGGAILWAGIKGTVTNCRFIDNEAIKNPNFNVSGRGGAVYLQNCSHGNNDTSFYDCYFEGNVAGTNGGAVDWHEGAHNGLVDNCTFINNTAKRSGGAIFWNGHNGTVKYSKFYNNHALGIVNATSVHGPITYGGDGGAIMWSGSLGKVFYSNFVNNTAAARGGGVFLQGSDIEKKCENTRFNHSYFVNNVAGTNGGAIDWNNEAIDGFVEDVKFINNTAKRSGGAIFWRGFNGTVKNSTFINNRATGDYLEYDMNLTYDNVVIINQNSTVNITEKGKLYVLNYTLGNGKLKFESYVVDKDGKHLLIDEEIVRVDDDISPVDWGIDQFFGGDGGTILWMGDVGLVDNCTFIGSNSRRRGGGAYMTGSDNVTYNDCYFENCTSGTNGGGLDWLAGANNGRIYNCVFNHTRAARSAGAIYYDGDSGRMENITIIGTKAWGGSLDWGDDHMTHYIGWDSSHWDTNTTGGDGGAIMITGDHEYLYNITFTNCIATGRGGAVFLQDNYNVTFDLCVFKNNKAEGTANNTYNDDYDTDSGLNKFLTGNGGAIGFDYGARLGVIKNSEFINNTAVRLGGAISFAKGSKDDTIEHCTFTNNTAYRSGGAISWDGENGNMIWCNFTNNRALGTDIDANLFNLTSLSLIKNVTSMSEINSDKYLYVLVGYNGTNKTNYTMYVYKDGKPVYLEFTTEVGPSPTDWAMDEYFGGDGGTIFWRGDHGTVNHCNFVNSNSARRGGGAYMTGSDYITFQNCNFTNCTSGTNGGGLDWLAGANYGKVINCTFNETRAARSAGAIYYDGDYGEMRNLYIINTRSWGGTLASDRGVNYAGWDSSHWDTNTTGGDAGAIMFTGNHEYVYNVTFINTTAQGRGGAVFLQDNENITFDLCKFIGCEALGNATNTWKDYTKERDDSKEETKLDYKLTGHGGAIAFDVGAHDTVIKYSEFTYNYARRDGGAINIADDSFNATIEDCNFTNNSAGDDGGAINWVGDLGLVKHIICYNNTGVAYADPVTGASSSLGGTMCIEGHNVTVTQSSFTLSQVLFNEGNLTKTNAGAIAISGENTTVSHSTFDTCFAPNNAGAVSIIGNHTTFVNCTFTNCYSAEDGAAIYVDGRYCELHNSTFINNAAGDDGGAVYWNGHNGIIYNITCYNNKGISRDDSHSNGGTLAITGDYVSVDKSSFKVSSALVVGGAIYLTGSHVNITNSEFDDCNVSYTANDIAGKTYVNGGGAIYIIGDYVNIVDSNFTDTHGREGGAIYIQGHDVTIDGAIINSTHAYISGGAIYIEGASASVLNSEIYNTVAKSGSSFPVSNKKPINMGGAIFINGNYANISNCKVESSEAGSGGAIYSTGSFSTVFNSNFTNNSAYYDGGAIYWEGETNSQHNTVDTCVFTGNVAYGMHAEKASTIGGGAIFWSQKGKWGSVLNSNFTKNSVQANGKADGGAILWDQSYHGIIDGCIFDGNFATTTGEITSEIYVQGGALFLRAADNYTVSNCLFKNCWSSKEAGAVYLSVRLGTNPNGVRFTNVTFINNTAKEIGGDVKGDSRGGGAVFMKDTITNYVFNNVTFINNTAKHGGALSFHTTNGNLATFNNLTFIGNEATVEGGSIYATANTLRIYDSKIIGGYSATVGGGIYANVNIVYNNLTFINNTADEKGGALYWSYNNARTIKDMIFINNSAYQGGAIFLPAIGKDVTVQNNNFTGNKATYGGAIYVLESASVTISENNFTGNKAVYGGAIYKSNGNHAITIKDSVFRENQADYGGAIDMLVSAEASAGSGVKNNKIIQNCKFIDNLANVDGGAVYVAGSYQRILNCMFDGNTATNNGGSVYVTDSLLLTTINDSNFTNSNAREGGAIYKGNAPTATLTITNDIFRNNTATHNGGALLYMLNSEKFRDYNEFDGRAPADPSTGRTTFGTLAITTSLFEDNSDYPFAVVARSLDESPTIIVYLTHPLDQDGNSIYFIVNITNSSDGKVWEPFIVDPSNYDLHYDGSNAYISLEDLQIKGNYSFTVGFEDDNYMYKELSKNATAKGIAIGEFELLQNYINNEIERQQASHAEVYIINLTRDYSFTRDYYNNRLDTSCMNLTNIDKPVIIYGNNMLLNARGFARIFNITASNVTFYNVRFAYGNASGNFSDNVSMGGALFWVGSYGSVIGSQFYDNFAERGGAIYFNASANDCTIINTTFSNNNATTFGGAIDCNATRMGLFNTTFENNFADTGAALCREINATEGYGFNNTFRKNVALTNGSALAWINAKRISIDTYYFYENHVGNSGGAIYVGQGSENCVIKNSVFEDNYVDNDADGHGGAIEWYSKEGTVLNSNFTRNHAYHGGAIYVGFGSDKINITGSTFTENRAHIEGGAISIESSSVIVRESGFYYNDATYGGALYVGGEGNIDYVYSSNFVGNEAKDGVGGAIDWVASSGTIEDSNLTANCANYGGGIYFGGNASESRITNCNFNSNHAKYKGGAIDCNSSAMYLTDTTFNDNWAQYGAALCREVNAKGGQGANNTFTNNHAYVSGAALAWMGSVNITITKYTFINNSADVSGGAIYVSPDSHNSSIIDSHFKNNYVTNVTNGGIEEFTWTAWDGTPMKYEIVLTDDPNLINKTIINDTVTTYYYAYGQDYTENLGLGGAVVILASNATIINTEFVENTARLGGAIYVGAESGNTIVNRSNFTSNHAYERGGAINLHASGVHIDDGEFKYNTAVDGGALYAGGIGTNNVVHTTLFEGNDATNRGGGIYWRAAAGEIKGSEFTDNHAKNGGGIYLNGISQNTNITNTIFRLNNADENGGAIDCNAQNIGIYNLTFDKNYAGRYGAALCREINATGGHGDHNNFTNNHAEISGAAIAWMGVKDIHIDYYIFINNTAGSSGGAIYIGEGSDNCVINMSYFEGNHIVNSTGGHGGAIDIVADNADIFNSNFTENYAFHGGAIWVGSKSGNTDILNVTFTRNSAEYDGGAVALLASGVTMNDTRYINNTAGRHAGAVYVGGVGTTNGVYNSLFKGNEAGDHGGAIDWVATAGEIIDTNFTRNSAKYGGAIYLNGISSQSEIRNVIFMYNDASKNGGAIDCNSTKMGLYNTQFISNTAGEYGGGLCREANATDGHGTNNTFDSNNAGISGGALAWLDVDNIHITNYTFICNTAARSGGAIFVGQGSDNCIIEVCDFKSNNATVGHGGAIDIHANNATVKNSTFENSIATGGGAIYVHEDSDTTRIINSTFTLCRSLAEGGAISWNGQEGLIMGSNFISSFAFDQGGAIAGVNANNMTITDVIFKYSVSSGYQTPEAVSRGSGAAIYWENGDNFVFTNLTINEAESHAYGGAFAIINCSNSIIANSSITGAIALRNGGTIYWINSRNVTVDSFYFNATAASFNGGAIYFENVTGNVKNSTFNNVGATWGVGGGIYIDGNVTVDDSRFTIGDSLNKDSNFIAFAGGNSTLSNSNLVGENAILVYKGAEAHLYNNTITGPNSNKERHYLTDNSTKAIKDTDYSIWNNGFLYLDGNNFDYVIFNNGTIMTQTTMFILDNKTWEGEWNTSFTFWAYIIDDNNNTIISVNSLDTYNNVYGNKEGYTYFMPYNCNTQLTLAYQGTYIIYGNDTGLAKCDMRSGIIKVKMPTKLVITTSDIHREVIYFYAEISTPALSNFTVNGETVHFRIGNKEIDGVIKDGHAQWQVALSEINQTHMHVGTYK